MLQSFCTDPFFIVHCTVTDQARRKVWNIGGAIDFCGKFILESRIIGGAKCCFFLYFKKYWECYSTPSSYGPADHLTKISIEHKFCSFLVLCYPNNNETTMSSICSFDDQNICRVYHNQAIINLWNCTYVG